MEEKYVATSYSAISRGLDHEAKVMDHRITWAILYSAGLFAASAILINIIVTRVPNSSILTGLILLIMSGISATGVYFSWTTRAGVMAAQNQFRYLYEEYYKHQEAFDAAFLPRPMGDRLAHRSGNFAAMVFPHIMLVSWGSAFVLEFCIGLLLAGAPLMDLARAYWSS